MNKLIACGFAVVLCSANADVIDLTQAARAAKAYTVTASSSGTYGPAKLVDGALQWSNDTWSSAPFGADKTEWVEFDFGDQYEPGKIICLESYSIYQNNANMGNSDSASRSPSDFTLEGSNDGEAWTVLDTRSGLTFSGYWKGNGTGWRNFPIRVKDIGFRRYRLVMTKPAGSSATYYSITEWKLVGRLLDSAAEVTKYRYWDGTVSDDWNDPENWTPDAEGNRTVPGAGESVVIGDRAAATVTISSSTAELESLSLGEWSLSSALTVSNWTTTVFADEFTVGDAGVVTCAGPMLNDADLCRVSIACSNLTIAAGGKIDVNSKGYAQRPNKNDTYQKGAGPGAYQAKDFDVGASHGGYGAARAKCSAEGFRLPIMPNDNPAAPVQPGSSGFLQFGSPIGHGGGAVRIVATGRVSVDGSILANGGNASGYGQAGWNSYGDNHTAAGAGGSIWIECGEIAGAGVISANGGGGNCMTASNPGMAGGGGMIAIHYDTAHQTADAVEGMRITAAAGLCKRGNQSPVAPNPITWYETTNVTADETHNEADIGTLHFTDGTLIRKLIGKGLTGQIRGVDEFTYEGDLEFVSGHLRFAEDGARVNITGNLTFNGDDPRLELGGNEVRTNYAYIVLYTGTTAPELNVGGDLTLGGVSSRLDIRSAETAANGIGAFVRVGGTMTVSTNCSVYAWSGLDVACGPKFFVGNLTVAEGGVFSADRRGGGFGRYGSGAGQEGSIAGGHGGKGGGSYGSKGVVNDVADRPAMPGSAANGSYNGWSVGGFGGGIIAVVASNGTIRVDGLVTADGENGGSGGGAGGAGGTVIFDAKVIAGSATGVIRANGGGGQPNGTGTIKAGCGGGGRIALWCGRTWADDIRLSKIRISDDPAATAAYADYYSFAGTVSAVTGVGVGEAPQYATPGTDGTVRYAYIPERGGFLLLVR